MDLGSPQWLHLWHACQSNLESMRVTSQPEAADDNLKPCCHQDNHAKNKNKRLNMICDGKLWRYLSLSRCIEWWKLASLKHDWMNAQWGTIGESRALLKFNNIRHSLLGGAKKNSLIWLWKFCEIGGKQACLAISWGLIRLCVLHLEQAWVSCKVGAK